MFKKLLNAFMVLAFLSTILSAQTAERLILRPNGDQIKIDKNVDFKEAIKKVQLKNADGKVVKSSFMEPNFNVTGTLDTLGGGLAGTNFGFFGQDAFIQYFVAPADMTIKGAGFDISDDEGAANGVSLRLIKLNWTFDDLANVDADLHMGRYPAVGNGYNDVDHLGENNPTGVWEDLTGGTYPLPPWTDNADPAANTFDYDLWSDGLDGAPFIPVNDGEYQWVETALLFEPTLLQGEVFAVLLEHEATTLDETGNRIGVTAEVIGIPGWKFYQAPRSTDGTEGWHARTYTWDFVVAVDLTGDRAPSINSFDQLATTLSTEAQTVTADISDDNPSGGNAGVASVTLSYSIDDGDFVDVPMTGTEPNFSADIPGQVPGTEITYKINAVDVEGLNALETPPYSYSIFEIINTEALVVFNGLSGASGYPQSYYFGTGHGFVDWTRDSWGFGPLTEELTNSYQNIIEICAGGPTADNSELITAWLAADATRNYMLAGDEWLGAVAYGWPGWDSPITTTDGEFARDILGVDVYYSDINVDAGAPTDVMAVEGSLLGGALYTAYTQRQADSGYTGPILYDPAYEITQSNWLDGVDFLGDVEVDLNGVASDSVTVIPIAGHRTLPAGNKVAFFAYDPLSLNQGGAEYEWWGFNIVSPQNQVLDWFGGLVSVKQTDDAIPNKYKLSQNYPNPFNPSTTIEFSIPEKGLISLKIYNILGQEVAQVLNRSLTAGSYSVDFDASQLSSGMYVYSIQAGNVEVSKKMMLLK